MSTRWDRDDFWPEIEPARPPLRPVAWDAVFVYCAPVICWIGALLLVFYAKGWL